MKGQLFRKIIFLPMLLACLCFAAGGGVSYGLEEPAFDINTAENSPAWITDLAAAKEAEAAVESEEAVNISQLFVVGVTGGSVAKVSMHQKDAAGNWKQILETSGYIGRNGLGKTKEGDGKTPIGTYKFTKAFGIAADPGSKMEYYQVTTDDYWSGDQREGHHYNEMVSIKDDPDLNKSASEHLVQYNPHYLYCLNISWNEKCTPGKGSAIFLHCLGYNPYTAGCVAIPEKQMVKVLQNVQPDCVVVIDYMETLNQKKGE